ncbi:MAG TPA: response regulator [Phototrophicaceae bacterium]|nr:response regulator [Phototrophicaceae bacterium]
MLNHNRTFLIVDDEPDFAVILEMMLKRAGYQTITASSGGEALGLIQQHQPDVVLLDDMLPIMNGSEVCRRLKQNPSTASIPVILMSAAEQRLRDHNFIQTIGADCVLIKPFKLDELVEVAARLLA